jgi:hypothetical protein
MLVMLQVTSMAQEVVQEVAGISLPIDMCQVMLINSQTAERRSREYRADRKGAESREFVPYLTLRSPGA